MMTLSAFPRMIATTLAVIALLIGAGSTDAHAQSATTFTYQGYLEDGGAPAAGSFDFEFELYDGASSGTQVGATVEVTGVTVTDGVFAVDLDFGAVFGAEPRYLEVAARPSGSGSYTTLSPREALRAAPLATALPYLRVEPATDGNGNINPNVIGGNPANTVDSGVYGATIAGGGFVGGLGSFPNTVTGSYGTVGGGDNNTADNFATVSGGEANTADGQFATVGGGFVNTASGDFATIVGGSRNTANGNYSFAAGRRAKAQNDGTFVWADSEDADFASTAPDQFLVRSNFVGINRATTIGTGEIFGIRANTAASPSNFGGMYIEATGPTGQPFYGYAVDGDNPAYHYYSPSRDKWVLFVGGSGNSSLFSFSSNGDLNVPGRLTKGSGSFMIDHPQAPTEKTLSHSFVESPDMMNVYNGNVTLGADGTATVDLPGYFEALNKDFRYQLTPIGAPGPNLYVAEEISGNRFRIAGGTAGMRVSWQVTGVRDDPYARKHRIDVEEDKAPDDRGTYLHPEAYGRER